MYRRRFSGREIKRPGSRKRIPTTTRYMKLPNAPELSRGEQNVVNSYIKQTESQMNSRRPTARTGQHFPSWVSQYVNRYYHVVRKSPITNTPPPVAKPMQRNVISRHHSKLAAQKASRLNKAITRVVPEPKESKFNYRVVNVNKMRNLKR